MAEFTDIIFPTNKVLSTQPTDTALPTDKVLSTDTSQSMELTEKLKKLQAEACSHCVQKLEKKESWWLKNRGKFFGGALAITGIGLLAYGIYSYFKNKKEDKTEDADLQKQGLAKADATTDKSSDAKTELAQKTQANPKSTDSKIPGKNITNESTEPSPAQLARVSQTSQHR